MLDQLRAMVFFACLSKSSFSGAARELRHLQSVASQQIRSLEQDGSCSFTSLNKKVEFNWKQARLFPQLSNAPPLLLNVAKYVSMNCAMISWVSCE